MNGTVDNVEVCAKLVTSTERTISLNVSVWDESACKFNILCCCIHTQAINKRHRYYNISAIVSVLHTATYTLYATMR